MKSGILDLSARVWEVELVDDQVGIDCKAVFRAAIEDVFDIVEHLCTLLGGGFTRPSIVVGKGRKRLILDISTTKMWSEIESMPGVVYVRNDYYERRDNYRVACCDPIVYDTTAPERWEVVDESLEFFLRYLFGYERFRPGQAGVIRKALARNATLGILPTGSGKSLCYQMACLLQPCVSFVVCPIISLIQDQELNARQAGLCRVGRIDSQMESSQKNEILERFGKGFYQFIWISPERFQMKDFREQLCGVGVFGYSVIDEVHCLSEWGHDFRVSYLKLYDTMQMCCPGAVTLALTATASKNVLEDLLSELHITRANVQTSPSLDRPELTYHIIKTSEPERADTLWRVLDEVNDVFREREGVSSIFEANGDDSICGIIFCNTKGGLRQSACCHGVVSLLKEKDVKADEYHSGREGERSRIQQEFLDNKFTVMAATKAFGMGVNKKNVRYTIHDGLPWSIEAFYQEAGRAGRDETRNESECYIVFSDESDPALVKKVFARDTTIDEIREAQSHLDGDLETLLYLWCGNHEDISIERRVVLEVFKELMHRRDRNGMAVVEGDLVDTIMRRDGEIFKAVNARTRRRGMVKVHIGTQDALYKLALLGIVKDWTVDYRGRGYCEVVVGEIDSSSEGYVKQSLEEYIGRHDPLFSFDSKLPQHQHYVEMYESAPAGNKLVGLIDVLLQWTNDHIVFNRRQAVKNMLDLCERDWPEEETRNYINNFFRLDAANNDQLDVIVRTSDDIEVWSRLFTEYHKTDEPGVHEEAIKGSQEMKAISALCDRFRESYHSNIGLEWATLVARLLSDTYSIEETGEIFGFISGELGGFPSIDRDALLRQTIGLLKHAGAGARSAFGSAVVAYAPGRAGFVYGELGDTSTLEHLVVSATATLKERWGRIDA